MSARVEYILLPGDASLLGGLPLRVVSSSDALPGRLGERRAPRSPRGSPEFLYDCDVPSERNLTVVRDTGFEPVFLPVWSFFLLPTKISG
jgi:hypothetical protein